MKTYIWIILTALVAICIAGYFGEQHHEARVAEVAGW